MKEGYYTSGQFANKAGVTLRTIRFYDKKNLLKPSYRNANGNRFYTDADLARLQQILLLKYLGFSLEEIREITLGSSDRAYFKNSLEIQKKLLQERITEMQSMLTAIDDTTAALDQDQKIEWSSMMHLIRLTSMERSMKDQYLNSSNISARIRLHHDYSLNRQGWFPWVFDHLEMKKGMNVLEVGCGSGALWTEDQKKIPDRISIVLSDSSEGMVHDVERVLGKDARFAFRTFPVEKIPYEDDSFDLVIADHVLFYCRDVSVAVKEIHRVLKPGGRLIASTYGSDHMKEITELVQGFDPEIVLSANHLYETFGLENGESTLSESFDDIRKVLYDDAIEISEPEPLIAYILSCHGNQNQKLVDRYKEFHSYVSHKVEGGFHITKDAGIFICSK